MLRYLRIFANNIELQRHNTPSQKSKRHATRNGVAKATEKLKIKRSYVYSAAKETGQTGTDRIIPLSKSNVINIFLLSNLLHGSRTNFLVNNFF